MIILNNYFWRSETMMEEQACMMKYFAKIFDSQRPLTIFAKKLHNRYVTEYLKRSWRYLPSQHLPAQS